MLAPPTRPVGYSAGRTRTHAYSDQKLLVTTFNKPRAYTWTYTVAFKGVNWFINERNEHIKLKVAIFVALLEADTFFPPRLQFCKEHSGDTKIHSWYSSIRSWIFHSPKVFSIVQAIWEIYHWGYCLVYMSILVASQTKIVKHLLNHVRVTSISLNL